MRRWKCTVCGYIHLGNEPPDICPVCGADRSAFVDDGPADIGETLPLAIWGMVRPVLFQISYGLFILGTTAEGRLNGATVNAFMQVAEDPLRVAVAVTKDSLSHEYLLRNPAAAVTFLRDGDAGYNLARHFGTQSGRAIDKFASIPHREAANGCPIVAAGLSFLELALLPGAQLDAGSHTLFLAAIKNGGVLNQGEPLTYARYHAIKAAG